MKLIHKFVFTASFSLLLFCANATAQEIGYYIEQYEGHFNGKIIKVKILRIGEKLNEEVLIQLSGVDDPVDSLIYKYKKLWKNSEKRFNEYAYVTRQIPGLEKFSLFHSESRSGTQVFTIYLTNRPDIPIEIYPTIQQEDLDPENMFDRYLEQLKKSINN